MSYPAYIGNNNSTRRSDICPYSIISRLLILLQESSTTKEYYKISAIIDKLLALFLTPDEILNNLRQQTHHFGSEGLSLPAVN